MTDRVTSRTWLLPRRLCTEFNLANFSLTCSMPNFLKSTLATLLGLLIFCGLGIGGLLVLIVVGLRDTSPQVKDKSILVLDLSLSIQDVDPSRPPSEALSQSLQGDSRNSNIIRLRTVLKALDQASRDPRIVGLYLRGNTSPGITGFANLLETRQAIERFRASGKPIVAYDTDWSEREYYLGSLATKLFINPLGTLTIDGLSSETTFFTGTLQKYGVDIQVTRVGKYKSAVEPFLLTKSSPESREQEQLLLTDLWTEWLTTVGKYRKLPTKDLQAVADNQGVLLPKETLQQKLVDQIALPAEVANELKQISGTDAKKESSPQIDVRSYARAIDGDADRAKSSRNRVAVLYAQGEIRSGKSTAGSIGSDSVVRQLRKLRQDKAVKAIVLRINSPGGSVTASELIQEEVVQARKAKPVIVSMGNVAASGGYWIATYADQIYAEPTTITGSIGVFGLLPNIQKLANSQGITWDTVKTAKYADMNTISRPLTPSELAVNQKLVDWIYGEFLNKVAESRKLPKAKVAEIAQGRVWSGVAAKKLGLVDEMGGLEQAIAAAAKRANLGDNWQVDEYPATRSLSEQLFRNDNDPDAQLPITDPLTAEYQQIQQIFTIIQSLDDPRSIYARLPFTLEIK